MSRPPMPIKLLVVLVLLCLNLANNLYNLSSALAGTADYVRIALNIGLLVGLLRGAEWARVLAKVTAILTLVAGVLTLLSLAALSSLLPPGGMVFLYAMIGLALVYGVFLLWCMSQPDVQEWLASRAMRG